MRRTWNAVILSMRNLALHKLRSLLTMLGLIFGVASVVAMLSVAEGAKLEAQRQIAGLGATNIILRSVKPVVDAEARRDDNYVLAYGLTHDDFDRFLKTMPTVIGATRSRTYRKEVRHLDKALETRIVGADPSALDLNGLKIVEGRPITQDDLDRFANVAVLGQEAAKYLFPFGDPVGQSVRVGEDQYFRIIGIAEAPTLQSATGSELDLGEASGADDLNQDVYIPLTTDRVRIGETIFTDSEGSFSAERIELSRITVAVDEIDNVRRTARELESLLGQFHDRRDYAIVVPLELLAKVEAAKRIFNIVLGSIAGISLLVGGIGIMNIMLATVTERTREIGIRRALGAKQRDITFQFLVETGVLSASGGLLGVLVGLAIPPAIATLSGVPAAIRIEFAVIAFAIASLTGVLFGVYPARRAAGMDPIEALRTE